MKFHSLSRYLVAIASAVLLGSCGGGGSNNTVAIGGPLIINPDGATFYAGVKATMTVNGGRTPYLLTSSEPGLFPVPSQLDGHSFDVVPGQPGVIDAGLDDDALRVRTVIITARSASDGTTVSASVKIGQNFLTGYAMFFFSSTCGSVSPCAGGETVIFFDSTFNGTLNPNRTFRIERVRGPFQFVDPLNTNNQVDAVTVVSDHEGKFTTVIRVATGTPGEVGLIKITDVATGAYVYQAFTISGTPATAGLLTIIPPTTTLTGPNGQLCGYGSFDVLVFDGAPPYTVLCTNPNIFIVNSTSNSQPGRFTLSVGANTVCMQAETCVITDRNGARNTFTITTVKGTTTPPPAMVVAPTAISLGCGASGSVTVVGGSGSYSVNSTHPRVTAVVSGNTVTITRLPGPDPAGGPFAGTATISITDGTTISTVTATVPPAC